MIKRREREKQGMLELLYTTFQTSSLELWSRLRVPALPFQTSTERDCYRREYQAIADQHVAHVRPASFGLRDSAAVMDTLHTFAGRYQQAFCDALSMSQQLRDDALWDDLPTGTGH